MDYLFSDGRKSSSHEKTQIGILLSERSQSEKPDSPEKTDVYIR